MARLTIHATNVTGLGACQVVVSFLEGLESLQHSFSAINCYVPETGPVGDYVPKTEKLSIIKFRRKGPKALSRVAECMFPSFFFDIGEKLIVLGDVPLRASRKQLVLIHQPHLQAPSQNRWVSKAISFRLMRGLTKLNASFVDRVVVQTTAMASGLDGSYPDWSRRDCINVIGQPPPNWFTLAPDSSTLAIAQRGLRLFYPAAGYPHKNHRIFNGLLPLDLGGLIDRLVLTIDPKQFAHHPAWLSCVGALSHADCLTQYRNADAVVFPSFLESYGLPLVEAMVSGKPIIAADLPYARVLCGDQAIYFDPESAESLLDGCRELRRRLRSGWSPDWTGMLEPMPKSWQQVAELFLRELEH